MVDGRNHGLWIWYYDDGRKKMQGRFNHGEREGMWMTFSRAGDTLSKSTYHKDMLNGEYCVYGDDGTILERISFVNDRPY